MLTLRVLLSSAAAMLLLASGVSGQVQGDCPRGDLTEQCTVTTMSSSNAGNTVVAPSATLTATFLYCAPIVPGTGLAYGFGPILPRATGSLTVQPTTGTATTYRVTGIQGSLTTVLNAAAPSGTALIQTFSADTAITLTNDLTQTNLGQFFLQTNAPNVFTNGVTILNSASIIADTGSRSLAFVTTANCGDISGDPLFSGFKGQQFYVGGEDGQVMNVLSTFNMQLNGRFVNLEENQAIKPDEQEKIRLASEIAHQSEPSLAAFPKTVAWSHPGNYFGEIGVALLDENRLYAKAGSFQSGFAKVALNGRPLPVSDDFVVLGQGVNTTYIHRVSAHELMVRTVNVEFTVTNSDNFINVQNVHLEKGFRQHNKFTGLLGNTVDAKWTWNKKDEEDSFVQSNDLFAHDQ